MDATSHMWLFEFKLTRTCPSSNRALDSAGLESCSPKCGLRAKVAPLGWPAGHGSIPGVACVKSRLQSQICWVRAGILTRSQVNSRHIQVWKAQALTFFPQTACFGMPLKPSCKQWKIFHCYASVSLVSSLLSMLQKPRGGSTCDGALNSSQSGFQHFLAVASDEETVWVADSCT